MARLPGDRYLIQCIGDNVVLFEDYTERTLAKALASDEHSVECAIGSILESELTDEQKSFAYFWFGYFHGYATGFAGDDSVAVGKNAIAIVGAKTGVGADIAVYNTPSCKKVVRANGCDANAVAVAQHAIHLSDIPADEKPFVHFWFGYFYGDVNA
jgi:hypothetical protein